MPLSPLSALRDRPNLAFAAVVLLIATAGILLRLHHGISGPIEGLHAFRQSHVASNIEFYLRDGLGIAGEMFAKNNRDRIFDFPLYQFLAVAVTRLLDVEPVLAGRLLNLAVFAAFLAVVAALLHRSGLPRTVTLLTLWLIAISPLRIYYDRAIIPDHLAILLAYLSLLCLLESDRRGLRFDLLLGAAILTGVLASLIKNPLYLPVVAAIGLNYLIRLEYRKLLSPQFLTWLVVIGLTVVLFRLYTNYENIGRWSLAVPTQWYYGTLEDRLQIRSYLGLYRHLREILPPGLLLLAPLGLIATLRRWREQALFLCLLAGHLASIAIFFRLHVIHDYYMLHTVFIVCFFAAVGIAWLIGLAARALARVPGRVGPGAARAVRPALLAVIAVTGIAIAQTRLVHGPNWGWVRTGDFIAERTPEDAVVLFMLDRRRWDPQFLYYARREGLMIGPGELGEPRLHRRLEAEFEPARPLYAFIKRSQVEALDAGTLASLEPVSERPEGTLYRMSGPLRPAAGD